MIVVTMRLDANAKITRHHPAILCAAKGRGQGKQPAAEELEGPVDLKAEDFVLIITFTFEGLQICDLTVSGCIEDRSRWLKIINAAGD